MLNSNKKRWQIFEEDCCNYLNKTYQSMGVNFVKNGDCNCNLSDILTTPKLKPAFNIEVKMKICQSGQFALRLEDDKFVYSSSNKYEQDLLSESIIEYINDNLNIFKNVKQSSLKIDLPESLFAKWIICHYSHLDSKYIITGDKNKKIILPIEKVNDYFKINCHLRRKKSGSRDLPECDYDKVKNYIISKIDKNVVFFKIKNKSFVDFSGETPYTDSFTIGSDTYKIVPYDNQLFQIRKLGITNNPSVVFSLKLKKGIQDESDLNAFIKDIT